MQQERVERIPIFSSSIQAAGRIASSWPLSCHAHHYSVPVDDNLLILIRYDKILNKIFVLQMNMIFSTALSVHKWRWRESLSEQKRFAFKCHSLISLGRHIQRKRHTQIFGWINRRSKTENRKKIQFKLERKMYCKELHDSWEVFGGRADDVSGWVYQSVVYCCMLEVREFLRETSSNIPTVV